MLQQRWLRLLLGSELAKEPDGTCHKIRVFIQEREQGAVEALKAKRGVDHEYVRRLRQINRIVTGDRHGFALDGDERCLSFTGTIL